SSARWLNATRVASRSVEARSRDRAVTDRVVAANTAPSDAATRTPTATTTRASKRRCHECCRGDEPVVGTGASVVMEGVTKRVGDTDVQRGSAVLLRELACLMKDVQLNR